MSKFYYGLINQLRRSLFIVASSQVKIPVFFTMMVDPVLLDTGKVKSIAIKKYSQTWRDNILSFLKGTLSNDELKRFDFNFSVEESYNKGHSITYDINTRLANARVIEANEKKREENRLKYNQSSIKELQQAYLNQDVDNNDFEEGSRLPSIED